METELLFDTLCETLAEAQAKTLDHKLGIVEAEPLADTVAYALPEAKYKTLSNGLVAVEHDAHVACQRQRLKHLAIRLWMWHPRYWSKDWLRLY